MVFVAILLLASTVEGEARCKHIYRPRANEYPRQEYYQVQPPCSLLDDCDRKAYGESERAAGWDWVLITCPFIGSAVAQGKLLVRNGASNPLASLEDVRKLGNTGVAILEICSWRLPAAIMRS